MIRRFQKISAAVILLNVVGMSLCAQSTVYRAAVKPVDVTGFYRIYIDPALSTAFVPSLSDLRILNKYSKPVPYVLFDSGRVADAFTNPAISFMRIDSSNGNTYLFFSNPSRFHFDRLRFAIKSPALYERRVNCLSREPGRKRVINHGYSFISAGSQSVEISLTNSAAFWLEIINAGSTPLELTGVETFASRRSLVAELNVNDRYILEGNGSMNRPLYDLESYRDSLSRVVIEAEAGPVTATAAEAAQVSPVRKIWLWGSLIVAAVALALVAGRMLKTVGTDDK